jgi:hypothetical protein
MMDQPSPIAQHDLRLYPIEPTRRMMAMVARVVSRRPSSVL